VSLLILSGCTSPMQYIHNGFKVGPNYERPPAPVAEDWIDASDKRLRKDCDHNCDWWLTLKDPVLNALIVQTYQENLTLRQAGYRVLAARARLAFNVGAFFPQQQNFTGSYTRNKVSVERANASPGIEQWFDNWQGQFNLAWELDFWGRYRRAIEAADDDLDASIEGFDDVLVTLLADTGTTYVQLRSFQKQLELTRANAELQRENYKIAKARFDGGLVSAADPDQALSDLSQTEALIPTLEISIRRANDRLCVLLGIPVRDLTKELGASPIPTPPPEVCVGIPADLLTRRPDIRRAERTAAAQCARIGVAESELYPHISIMGNIGLQAEHFGDLWKGTPAMIGQVGPSVQWNILNYGRLLSNIRFEDARFQELVANYQQTVLAAGADVEDALIAFVKLHDRVKSLQSSVDASRDGVRVAVANYQQGRINFVVVSTLQVSLLQQENLLAQAQGDLAISLIQVYRALGGGWQIRLADSNAAGACGAPSVLPRLWPPATPPAADEKKPAKADDSKPQQPMNNDVPKPKP
jgi:NodT family efflux transporter outer membrane factor (OMF) lipoprotein